MTAMTLEQATQVLRALDKVRSFMELCNATFPDYHHSPHWPKQGDPWPNEKDIRRCIEIVESEIYNLEHR